MANNLVAYSRAGDVFHYRWAARRCLGLVYPNATLRTIVIEGSIENIKEGEYVIDVAEYSEDADKAKQINYYQLKHTTVQKESPFVISDLKDTFVGFSKRFSQHFVETDSPSFLFTIVTNRPIENSFKQNIQSLANNEMVNHRFKETIKKYTGLPSDQLSDFCKLLTFEDDQGDYNEQKEELKTEIAHLIAGVMDNAQLESIVALVQEKVLPDSDGVISREDILKRFGISSEKDLYPAPAIWDQSENIIEREQHDKLKKNILKASDPVIIHASGGVGKSVFCQKLIASLPPDSVGIAYDCFGAGRYRNRSEPRHRHRDGLVQIINELAVKGLCDPLLIHDTSLDSSIMKKFLWRIEASVKALKQISDSASLFILIDAADNAEMAAKEFNHPCFANELLRESIPDGCKLVLLCRTERVELLKPNSKIAQFELEPFSQDETLTNLKRWFPEADVKDGMEFHRLTGGNPRVQGNALNIKESSVSELLNQLGPAGQSVEDQIELQLNTAVSKIKDSLSDMFQEQIQSICLGLASLPPHIPLDVLARASKTSKETIKSFVADLGRSLWLSDESVQFRDEPTETWFRKTFLAKKENYETYITILEPLAIQHTYVAEVLPHLYLQAEEYDKLIEIALSDNFLPGDNPIDARNVRVYRLQFAFRAALRANHHNDAIKIAMRAGEEMAGNERQLGLFKNNVDLLVSLQDKQMVQDIAFKRLLSGAWNGSENVYIASLLSGINDYKGEARGYLRAAINWLKIYYEEVPKNDHHHHHHHHQNEVSDQDILELAYAFFNIDGIRACIDFINRFSSKEFTFNIIQLLAKRLVDKGDFESIHSLLEHCVKQPYYIVAITSELFKTGQFPEKRLIAPSLELLMKSKTRIKRPDYVHYDDDILTGIVTFIEICLHRDLSKDKLLKVLKYYVPEKVSIGVYRAYQSKERNLFLKALAIRTLLEDKKELDINSVLPKNLAEKKKKNNYDRDKDIQELKEVINGLFPWYFLRIKIVSHQGINLTDEVKKANEKSKKATTNRYRSYDTLPNEIASLQASVLILSNKGTAAELNWFYDTYLKNNKALSIPEELNVVRAAFRVSHLFILKQQLERNAFERIKSITGDGPEQIAERYIELARAVLNEAPEDASVYFEEAVEIVSKFGDEIVRRWEAIVSLAKITCTGINASNELAYRFIRCAEVVGEYVSREKHWDRSEAIAISARMSSGVGISALSRWRDRDIGRFEYQLEALLKELVNSGKASTSIGWSLSRFFPYHQLESLLLICLENASETETKQRIFSDAVHLLQVEGSSPEYWAKMQSMASQHNIQNDTLDGILAYYQNNFALQKDGENEKIIPCSITSKEDFNWDDVFGDSNILNIEQIEKCLLAFKTLTESTTGYFGRIESFWEETIRRLSEKSLLEFADILLTSELDHYEMQSFCNSIPKEWKNKVSFKKNWPGVVRKIGKKYAHELVSPYYLKYFVRNTNLNANEIDSLKGGIVEGLATGYEFSDAEMFFGFIIMAAPTIKPESAMDLLDFALSRFELHVESDFGDGQWREDLFVTDNIHKNIAGFIWSALGSPRSEDRWNAVHSVRMLAEFNCFEVIDELICWMLLDKVEAFGSIKFPFYNLHAQQYLLIALARVSLNKTELLVKHKETFDLYAFGEPHAIIQKFSAEIAINILRDLDDSSNNEKINKLKAVGKSKLPIIDINYNETLQSYWHINEKVSTEYDFHFGWDFDRYWFEPLGDVFGIPGKQAEDVAAHVIVNEWGIKRGNGYDSDPRVSLWNRGSNERETWHDHGSYPKSDNLDFYFSYHSMMVAAAKLLEKMPIVSKNEWCENEWDEWLLGHVLTCMDGKWLADYRDPTPLQRPIWISEVKEENWKTALSEKDFMEALRIDDKSETWLNVYGGWEEKHGERTETFSIASSLVSRETSDALMRALETCSDPYDYKLPDYEKNNGEIYSDPFMLKGWIKNESISKGLDEYDPYGDNIDFPPYAIGSDIVRELNLSIKNDQKLWYSPISSSASVKCEIWSSLKEDRDENPDQSGKRLNASLGFLKHLCLILNCDLIIEVGIKRDTNHKYGSREDKYEYSKPIHKLFILSSNGELKSTQRSYKLG